mgnify:CR=1 FL=1
MAKGHRSQIKRARNESNRETRPSAKLSYARISVQKACYVLDAIRGKDVQTALGILAYNPRYASTLIEKLLNEKYGEGTVKLTITDQYKNMAEHVKPCMHLIDNAIAAMKALNVTPIIEPIRGGTDGATLSYMGLPCPNLGTGGFAYHGEYEHILCLYQNNYSKQHLMPLHQKALPQ